MLDKILLLLTLGVLSLPVSLGLVNAQTNSRTNNTPNKRPAPPKRIPPNKVKPGGGLNANRQACQEGKSSLTALVPIDNPVLTTRSHPSFLFYVPDEAAAMSYGEFSLFTANEKTRLYSRKIDLKHTPAIVKIDLPTSAQLSLETGQPYHWYFKIHCQNASDSPIVLDVDGWIERVPLTASRATQIEAGAPDIWYDAIATTVQNLLNTPEDSAARDRWLQLLKFIDREHLAEIKIQSATVTTD